MKKLFIAAAAVALAVGAQAASINWSIGGNTWYLSDGTTKAAKNTVVYLIDGAQWSTIKAAIDGGATSFTTADAGIIAIGQTSNTKGAVSGGTATSSALTAGTTYDFAYLVFDTGADKYFASATMTRAAYDPTNPVYSEPTAAEFTATQYVTTGLSGGWAAPGGATPPLPEPTSGILMLVGFGALALRRRKA